jgi:membrane associated rhomboid family serine protease
VPAWFALVGWILLQLVLAHLQLAGVSNVSALAHLGGAAVGLSFWALRREYAGAGEREVFASLRQEPRRR